MDPGISPFSMCCVNEEPGTALELRAALVKAMLGHPKATPYHWSSKLRRRWPHCQGKHNYWKMWEPEAMDFVGFIRKGIPTHHPRVYSIHSRTVTRYPTNSIVVVGGCPVCRVGVLEDVFTFLGIFLAIILFPFGFICCFALRKRRCPNCGATFT
ncbi:brain protein I3 isoform X1 [Otolemur garnettii]|uniref:brain protein I3 isoform X1 n=1 Tax=Otolemur garnettii TaxID=30611 RepID=UPI000C7F1289|nr:brain protein I3 isoform X1 [Otolemur garnettii]